MPTRKLIKKMSANFFLPHHADTRGPETRRRPSKRTKDFILWRQVHIIYSGKGEHVILMCSDKYRLLDKGKNTNYISYFVNKSYASVISNDKQINSISNPVL